MGNRFLNAAAAIRAARRAGVRIKVKGDRLVLTAPAPPPPEVIEALAKLKSEVVHILHKAAGDGWTADDWRVRYEERAAVAEYDNGLPRPQAEAVAYKACISEWLDRNPIPSPPGRCLGCGRPERPGDPLLPYGAGDDGRAWLHSSCWPAWYAARKAAAAAALAVAGIPGHNEGGP